MILDWIAREGGIVLAWWALATLMGAAALPLLWRLLGGLPDRGYTLARAAGILLTAFIFWLLTMFGFTRNTPGAMLLAGVIAAGVGVAVFAFLKRREDEESFSLRVWWAENRHVVVVGELLFFVLIVGWSLMRAHQSAIVATEKPMELAFISSVMRSETFPPSDPWLSGYAISYYYFGYVIAAMFSTLSGIPATMGFNMMVALLFALTGLTVFGIVYNLVRAGAFERLRGFSASGRKRKTDDEEDEGLALPTRRAALLTGLLGMVLVTLVSNYQFPLIELPYQTGAGTTSYLAFWDSDQRQEARLNGTSDVAGWDSWWWFRSARVLNDRHLDGSREEVIDEFPMFSFLLADVHPHVLALPFAALAIGLALNRLLRPRAPDLPEVLLCALVIGGLIFLNTWDGPVYAAVIVGAEAVRRLVRGGSGRLGMGDWTGLALLGAGLLGLGALFVVPFLISFRSQLGGVLPNLIYPTLFRQFFVHFAPLLLLLAVFLGVEVWRAGRRFSVRTFAGAALGILGVLIGLMLLFTLIGWIVPDLRQGVLQFVDDNGGWGAVIPDILSKRLTHILTSLVLAIGFGIVVARLFPRQRRAADDVITDPNDRYTVTYSLGTGFALLLVGLGIVVTLVPEWVYLRDLFGTRMNTVFKLYYQAWLLWGIAAAYGTYSVLADTRLRVPAVSLRFAFGAFTAVVVSIGLLYAVFGIYSRAMVETGRTSVFEPAPLTLEGGDRLVSGDDRAAALCLAQTVGARQDVTLISAVGGSYRGEYGATSTITGIPTVFNWPFHELQWRGGSFNDVAGSREGDIERLYTEPNFSVVQEIIARYGVDYIAFTDAERGKYGDAAEIRFRDRLPIVCEVGNSRYYATDTTIALNTQP